MREYQFLRNQLFRDRYTTVDVLLQSGKPGMSQEANKTLDDFPTTRQEMFDYDCVVAFDPNWQALKRRPGGTAGKLGGRTGRRPDRRGRAGQRLPRRRRLGAGPGHEHDPQSVPRRVSRPAGGDGKQHVFDAASRGRWLSPAKGSTPTSSGWPTRRPPAARLGPRFPASTATVPCEVPRPGPRSTPDSPTPAPPKAISSRSISPDSSTDRGSVFYMGSGEMWRLRAVDDSLLRAVLHEADPPRFAGPPAARLQPRRAAGRTGPVYAGQQRGGPGPTDQRPARTA